MPSEYARNLLRAATFVGRQSVRAWRAVVRPPKFNDSAGIVWLYVAAFVGGATAVLCLFFLGHIAEGDPFYDAFPKLRAVFIGWPKKTAPTLEEQLQLWTQIHAGTVVPSDQLLNAISNYYSSVITVLVGLFTLFAFVSVVTIQRISRSQIQESVEQHTQGAVKDYFQRADFQKQLDSASAASLKDAKAELTASLKDAKAELFSESDQLKAQIDELIERLTVLEGRMAVLDTAEENAPDQRVEE